MPGITARIENRTQEDAGKAAGLRPAQRGGRGPPRPVVPLAFCGIL